MEYLYKIEIKMNDEKIQKDGKYQHDSIYDVIRKLYAKYDISEVPGKEGYITFGSNKRDAYEFGKFGAVENTLLRTEWFSENVTEMTWHDYLHGKESVGDCLELAERYGLRWKNA